MNRLTSDAYIGTVFRHKYNKSFALPPSDFTSIEARF
jgi:hypothetical protein